MMKERIVAGQSCLSLDQEAKLYGLSDQDLEAQIRSLSPTLATAMLYQFGELQEQLRTFNSLLWIYIQREGTLKRIVQNIRLLWVLQGVVSINNFAHKLDLNPSFTGRLLAGDETGLGGWNLGNLMRICGVLEVRPEILLFSDLGKNLRQATGMKEDGVDYERIS